jgi:hypothetical protein
LNNKPLPNPPQKGGNSAPCLKCIFDRKMLTTMLAGVTVFETKSAHYS